VQGDSLLGTVPATLRPPQLLRRILSRQSRDLGKMPRHGQGSGAKAPDRHHARHAHALRAAGVHRGRRARQSEGDSRCGSAPKRLPRTTWCSKRSFARRRGLASPSWRSSPSTGLTSKPTASRCPADEAASPFRSAPKLLLGAASGGLLATGTEAALANIASSSRASIGFTRKMTSRSSVSGMRSAMFPPACSSRRSRTAALSASRAPTLLWKLPTWPAAARSSLLSCAILPHRTLPSTFATAVARPISKS